MVVEVKMVLIKRFIEDDYPDHNNVNKAVEFYKKKYNTDVVLSNVGSMSTREIYNNKTGYTRRFDGFNVEFLILDERDKK